MNDTGLGQGQLSLQDIIRLTHDPSAQTRAAIAGKIAGRLTQTPGSDVEHQLALEIGRIFLKDTAPEVRHALSEALQSSSVAPKDMVLALAQDDDAEVAAPVLENSPQLTLEELLAVVEATQAVIKLMAVARRKNVPTSLAGALVNKKLEEVSRTLVENNGAELDDAMMEDIAGDFFHVPDLVQSFMCRQPVPTKAVKRMVELSTNSTRLRIQQGPAEEEALSDISQSERDILREIFALGANPSQGACAELAESLNRSGALSPAVIAAALLLGNDLLFIACMSRRSRVPVEMLSELYHGGDTEFRQFYQKARLPFGMIGLFILLKDNASKLQGEGVQPNSHQCFQRSAACIREAVKGRIPYASKVGMQAVSMLEQYFADQRREA